MKFKKLCTYIAGLLTACLPLAGALAADLPAVDDPDVMDRVVAQRMLPISMTAPLIARNTPMVTGSSMGIRSAATCASISIMSTSTGITGKS